MFNTNADYLENQIDYFDMYWANQMMSVDIWTERLENLTRNCLDTQVVHTTIKTVYVIKSNI